MTVTAPTPTAGGPLSGPTGRRVLEHREAMVALLQSHGVTNAQVFGSAARGDDREDSDVDLLVDLAPGTDLFDLVRIKADLELLLGVRVDLVPREGVKDRVLRTSSGDLVSL